MGRSKLLGKQRNINLGRMTDAEWSLLQKRAKGQNLTVGALFLKAFRGDKKPDFTPDPKVKPKI